jgi:HK97 gp10 family phage protein
MHQQLSLAAITRSDPTMPVSIRVQVDASAAIAMLRAGAANMPNAIANSLERAGQNMVNYAQGIVPVRTGYLRSTITYEADEEELTLTATASYAGFVEFGTSRMAADPYLRPAFYAVMPQIADDLLEAITRGFE